MSQSKGSTEGQKRAYKRYEMEMRYTKNKKAKLNRHLKKYPNDKCAQKALGDVKFRRKAPKVSHWAKSEIKDQIIFSAAALVKDKQRGQPAGGDVRKHRERCMDELAKHLNLSTKNQKDGSAPVKSREHKTNMFQLGQRARYV